MGRLSLAPTPVVRLLDDEAITFAFLASRQVVIQAWEVDIVGHAISVAIQLSGRTAIGVNRCVGGRPRALVHCIVYTIAITVPLRSGTTLIVGRFTGSSVGALVDSLNWAKLPAEASGACVYLPGGKAVSGAPAAASA